MVIDILCDRSKEHSRRRRDGSVFVDDSGIKYVLRVSEKVDECDRSFSYFDYRAEFFNGVESGVSPYTIIGDSERYTLLYFGYSQHYIDRCWESIEKNSIAAIDNAVEIAKIAIEDDAMKALIKIGVYTQELLSWCKKRGYVAQDCKLKNGLFCYEITPSKPVERIDLNFFVEDCDLGTEYECRFSE